MFFHPFVKCACVRDFKASLPPVRTADRSRSQIFPNTAILSPRSSHDKEYCGNILPKKEITPTWYGGGGLFKAQWGLVGK